MPGQFLTEGEREQLRRFPAEIPPGDVIAYFTLSPADLAQVRQQRGDHNRLGFALQLGALRYLGFSPDDPTMAPASVVAYLSQQLDVRPDVLPAYGQRAHTRRDHLQAIQVYLGFREAGPVELRALGEWLVDRALEHDRPSLLFRVACEHLHAAKIIRPGVTRLERMVATARQRAQRETLQRLAPLLTEASRTRLDRLLVPDGATGRTPLTWLRQGATANSPAAILTTLEKLAWLRGWGVDRWDLSSLTPNRVKFLAQLGRRTTNQALQRAPEERRYPILLAFLHQALIDLTDEALDVFDGCLAETAARAGRELDEFRKAAARTTHDKLRLFRDLGRLVLDATVSDAELRTTIYRRIPPERLHAAVKECEELIRPLDDSAFEFLERRYSYLRWRTIPSWRPSTSSGTLMRITGARSPRRHRSTSSRANGSPTSLTPTAGLTGTPMNGVCCGNCEARSVQAISGSITAAALPTPKRISSHVSGGPAFVRKCASNCNYLQRERPVSMHMPRNSRRCWGM
jgi:TnpA family transposase